MLKKLLTTTALLSFGSTMAGAQAITPEEVMQTLESEGYTIREVKAGMTRIKVEAYGPNGEKLEVVYNRENGDLLKREVEWDDDDDDRGGMGGGSSYDDDDDRYDDDDDDRYDDDDDDRYDDDDDDRYDDDDDHDDDDDDDDHDDDDDDDDHDDDDDDHDDDDDDD